MAKFPYSLGCPIWACEHWRGLLYTSKAKRDDWLAQYSAVFNTVEGNSTFYALPSPETAQRWADSTADGFEFCLKFPRAITHDKSLHGIADETRAFRRILDILAEAGKLGPSFLQLPPAFDARGLNALATYVRAWPRDLPLAVEVRHADWFDGGPTEMALHDILHDGGHDRVLFDSRALYHAPPDTAAEEVSQTRKPKVPRRDISTSDRPFVRFIGRDDVSKIDPWIDEWAELVAGWVQFGLRPLVFCHTPDDTFAPEFCRRFHAALREKLDGLAVLAPFAGEIEEKPAEQLSLF